MAEKERLTSEKHKDQIDRYRPEQTRYETYATVLKRVLENACKISFPEAFVQSRPKSVSSFAEKAARKFDKYPDAVNQMTDLCGARVIVQTMEQVAAVKLFIEANFRIHEKDEKGVLLGEDKFGYRDMHYIIELRPDRNDALGIEPDEYDAIGNRKAELQVRTWLQHAWADTLHDRLYKNPLKLSSEIKRAGNLLAALMEEGDRNYNGMANELDGMIANYTAFATKKAVGDEIQIQKLILDNEPDPRKKPALALKLGRLLAADGDFAQVVEVLKPHQDICDANRCELLQDLGYALCKVHRTRPESEEYRRGWEMLKQAVDLCGKDDWSYVPHLRKRESLHARALARLAWALEPIRRERHQACEYYQKAHEHEPDNPYYLADMLGFEIYCSHDHSPSCAMRTTLREAIKICRCHAEAGIELPRAYFVAGRLCLLLDQPMDALGYYARGIRHCLAGTHCTPSDAMACEAEWVEKLHIGDQPPDGHRWVQDLPVLAEQVGRQGAAAADVVPKAIILSGGAASLDKAARDMIRPLLEDVLRSFKGTVISGGTTAGVPGCAGDVADSLTGREFQLIGYIPKRLSHDAQKDKRYDDIRVCGESGFTPDQILQSWRDLLADDIAAREVLCIGFGGGPLSAVEYRVALALGARVVVAHGSGGTAAAIASDALWSGIPNLMPIPIDQATFHALLTPGPNGLDPAKVLEMAQEFHLRYVAGSAQRLPANMRPWPKLDETYQKANIEQAKYAVLILEACGFRTRPSREPVSFTGFTDNRKYRLLFDPQNMEKEWADSAGIKGNAYGFMSSFTAALAARIVLSEDWKAKPDIAGGVEHGLRVIRLLRLVGHGDAKAEKPGFPFDMMAQSILGRQLLNSSDATEQKVDSRKLGSFGRTIIPALLPTCDSKRPCAAPTENVRSWRILEGLGAEQISPPGEPLYGIARRVALFGLKELRHVPFAQFGDLLTTDRDEIEALRNIKGLIQDYRHTAGRQKPLSLAVFGPPGAGKSFAIKQIAAGVLGSKPPPLEFNLSQFSDVSDLTGAFHQVRDRVLEGHLPLVFWDEFDSEGYEWLQYLLAPMQDGKFQEGQITHPIGRCVFVFAGATSYDMQSFGSCPKDAKGCEKFKLLKGPDFKSRLSGFLNVLGPNRRLICRWEEGPQGSHWPQWTDDPRDVCYPVRRALLLRSLLGLTKDRADERMDIDHGLLAALLEVDHYTDGARSLEKIVQSLRQASDCCFRRSALPTDEVLRMNADAEEFVRIVSGPKEFLKQAKDLANAVHDFFLQLGKREKWPIHFDMPYEQLPEPVKADNVAAALRIPWVLSLAGLYLVEGKPESDEEKATVRRAIETYLDTLAMEEHDLWIDFKRKNGWTLGSPRNDALKIHDCLKPFLELDEKNRDKDRNSVRRYPDIADHAGFKIVARRPT